MKFDTFLETVGDWGRFQKVKYTIICLTYMLPPIMVYTYTFTAAMPDLRCQNPAMQSNDSFTDIFNDYYEKTYLPTTEQCEKSGLKISVDECKRCYVRSTSKLNQTVGVSNDNIQPCNKYVFDRKYYTRTLVEEWNAACDRVEFLSSAQMVFFLGYMVGSIFFGILADKYGRRPVMSVSFILLSISGFLCAFGPQTAFGFWPSYIIFVTARFLIACATRGISVSGFVLGSEIVGPRKRLLAGIVIEYFFAFGQLFLLAFAYFIRTWRTLTWAISLFTVPYIFFYFILPESPRWLASKGHFNRAEKVLRDIAAINGREFNEDAFEQMKDEQQKSMSNQQQREGFHSLFSSKVMCIISINLFFQWFAQNFVFYGVSQSTGQWKLNPYLSFGLSALVELLAYILVHLILDRIGRKKPYILFGILFSILAFSVIPIQKYTTKNSRAQITMLNIINSALKFLGSATYAIIYIYANELFPTNLRNTGMGMCSMVARAGAILSTRGVYNLPRIWVHLPIICYGFASLISALLSFMFPETLNRPLPQSVVEVEQMGFMGFCGGKSETTITQAQSLSEIGEETIAKKDLQQCDTNGIKS